MLIALDDDGEIAAILKGDLVECDDALSNDDDVRHGDLRGWRLGDKSSLPEGKSASMERIGNVWDMRDRNAQKKGGHYQRRSGDTLSN